MCLEDALHDIHAKTWVFTPCSVITGQGFHNAGVFLEKKIYLICTEIFSLCAAMIFLTMYSGDILNLPYFRSW